MQIELEDGSAWIVPKDLVDKLCTAYRRDAVMAEFAKIDLWLAANPTRRKTRRGVRKFLVGWMLRANLPRNVGAVRVPTCCDCSRPRTCVVGGASFCDQHAPAPALVLA